MLQTGIHVVGDKFKGFATHENVYTYSEFIAEAAKTEVINRVILGQGLNSDQRLTLKALCKNGKIEQIDGIDMSFAKSTDTHKYAQKNILISDPIEIERHSNYQAQLMINDECAEMDDHVTGQHIQGVIYIEAARQMMLAVSEKYILPIEQAGNSYCALLSVVVKYHQFSFPLITNIIHEISGLTFKGSKHSATSNTSFYQGGELVAEVIICYLFNDKKYLEKKEIQLAAVALDRMSNSVKI